MVRRPVLVRRHARARLRRRPAPAGGPRRLRDRGHRLLAGGSRRHARTLAGGRRPADAGRGAAGGAPLADRGPARTGTSVTVSIEPLSEGVWAAVKRIFEEGIATGHATLEVEAQTWTEWDASHRATCRFVARRGGDVVGWVALSAPPPRRVYAGV